jgi:hypothetical protein
MGKLNFGTEEQGLANWICSDIQKNAPLYFEMCKEIIPKYSEYKSEDLTMSISGYHVYIEVPDTVTNSLGEILDVRDNLVCFRGDDVKYLLYDWENHNDDIEMVESKPMDLFNYWENGGEDGMSFFFEGKAHEMDIFDKINLSSFLTYIRNKKIDNILKKN